MSLSTLGGACCVLVDLRFFWVCLMWPLMVVISLGRYFWTVSWSKPGNVISCLIFDGFQPCGFYRAEACCI